MAPILIMMDWIVLVFLLCSTPSLASYSVSACYGSYQPCDYLHLNCTYAGYIDILSAVYLFAKDAICENSVNKDCAFKTSKDCCKAENGEWPTEFTEKDMQNLFVACNGRQNCNIQAPWTWQNVTISSLAEVRYACDEYTTPEQTTPTNNRQTSYKQTTSEKIPADPDILTEDDNSETAAIVVPIVVLLIVAVAVVLFIYWRRKKQKQSAKPGKPGIILNGILDTQVQNKDKNETENDIYHTSDPNTIPDHDTVEDKTVDSGPQDVYYMTDANKMDYETLVSHAHNEDASEYSKIQLDTHNIVAESMPES